MVRSILRWLLVVVAGFCVLAPSLAHAQAIAGVVRDESGAVIPGVTVEAASAALIEKARTAVTDPQGQYKILDLRPGTYTVTFTLSGFNTIKREGIELTTNFTANVNCVLKVGTLEEMITVSGASPTVDVQNATTQQVMTNEVLASMPLGQRNHQALALTAPGVRVSRIDVGGSEAMFYTTMMVHGSYGRDASIRVDGMNAVDGEGTGEIYGMYRDAGDNEEVVLQTSAISVEVSQGGVAVNYIGKEGGNQLKGSALIAYVPGSWESSNFTKRVQALGLKSPNSVSRIYDFNPTLGGPIVKDRLWFFGSARLWGTDRNIADSYMPDGSQTVADEQQANYSLRLTVQLTGANKLMIFHGRQPKRTLHYANISAGQAPNAAQKYTVPGIGVVQQQVKWTSAITSRLLLEAGFSGTFKHWDRNFQPEVATAAEKPPYGDIAKTDLILGTSWGAPSGGGNQSGWPRRLNFMGALAYVTGSHALKGGVQYGDARFRVTWDSHGHGDILQQYRNGVPASVVVYNTPTNSIPRSPDMGLFIQDSWTHRRLTVTPGLRWERYYTYLEERSASAGRFVAARSLPKSPNLVDWSNFAPRISAAYDLFGNGKTAIKASVAKYMMSYQTGFAQPYDLLGRVSDQRTWNDLNRNDIAEENEIGPANVPNFGQQLSRRLDPNIERTYNMEYQATLQHELMPRMSLQASYFHRKYSNLNSVKNVALTQNDYTPVTIVSPLNNEQITVYNLDPAKRAVVDNVETSSDTNAKMYHGLEFGINGRLAGGGIIFGSFTTGKEYERFCDVSDPNLLRFCDEGATMQWRSDFKMSAAFPLPWGLQLAGTFQSYSGKNESGAGSIGGKGYLRVQYNVNRTIIPTLTQTQVVVDLVEPGTKWLDRQNMLSLRAARAFRFGGRRITGTFDVYNLLNTDVIVDQRQVWGPTLDQPNKLLEGRLFKIGVQIDY